MIKTSINMKSLQKTKKPSWLKTKIKSGNNFNELKSLVKVGNLNTVCEEALCPNIFDCWERRSATLMILGDVCTRSCGFCNVKTGKPNSGGKVVPLSIILF